MIYFDHSSTCLPRPPAVIHAMTKALNALANPGRAAYEPSLAASRCLFRARQAVAAHLSLDDPLRVAFTSGATESLNLVLNGLLRPGDEVISTVLEHNSVLRPLALLACRVSYIPCDERGRLRLDALEQLLTPRTRLLVCTHGSNLCGSITDSQTLLAFCRAHGLIFVLDVAQTLGSLPLRADQADILCFSGHKALGGPPGTGGVVMAKDLALRAVKVGGTGEAVFELAAPRQMPEILEAGSPNVAGIAALAAALSLLEDTGIEQVRARERTLTRRLLVGLEQLPALRVRGPALEDERLAVVALDADDPAELALQLWEKYHIAVRSGFHCAPLAHRALGTAERGLLRVSLSRFNTELEVDALLNALAELTDKSSGRKSRD